MKTISLQTSGEKFYDITEKVRGSVSDLAKSESGIAFIFCQHTSCGLVINENYDPTAKLDMEAFLKHLAPRNLSFIQHTIEGEDDSPSHMKSMLIQQHLALPVEQGALVMGTWQGIFLAEFRDAAKNRKILIKFIAD